ncbi:MAG: hypothetical protein ACRD29_23385 [Acidimicrobiales bacterium]
MTRRHRRTHPRPHRRRRRFRRLLLVGGGLAGLLAYRNRRVTRYKAELASDHDTGDV